MHEVTLYTYVHARGGTLVAVCTCGWKGEERKYGSDLLDLTAADCAWQAGLEAGLHLEEHRAQIEEHDRELEHEYLRRSLMGVTSSSPRAHF